MSDELRDRATEFTQRLDHSVPEIMLTFEENRTAAADLGSLSSKLFWTLPDESLSPFERLERLARVVEDRTPQLDNLQSAAAKLEQLRKRLDELVPGDMTPERKVDALLEKLDEMVARDQRELPPIRKLELLGDPRGRVLPERPD